MVDLIQVEREFVNLKIDQKEVQRLWGKKNNGEYFHARILELQYLLIEFFAKNVRTDNVLGMIQDIEKTREVFLEFEVLKYLTLKKE